MRFQTCDFLMKGKENSETPDQVAVKLEERICVIKGCVICFLQNSDVRKLRSGVKSIWQTLDRCFCLYHIVLGYIF